MSFQEFMLLAIATALLMMVVGCCLLFKRVARLIDEAVKTLHLVNRLAPKLEHLVAEGERDVAAVRAFTTRLANTADQCDALIGRVGGGVERVVGRLERISTGIGKWATVASLVAGAAAWRRRHSEEKSHNNQESMNHSTVERSWS